MKLDPSWRGQTWCKCIVRLIDSPWFAGLNRCIGWVGVIYIYKPIYLWRWGGGRNCIFFWSSLKSDMFCFISEKNSWLVWCLQYAVKCPCFCPFPKDITKDRINVLSEMTFVCVCVFVLFFFHGCVKIEFPDTYVIDFPTITPRQSAARESGIKIAMCDIPSYQSYHFCLHCLTLTFSVLKMVEVGRLEDFNFPFGASWVSAFFPPPWGRGRHVRSQSVGCHRFPLRIYPWATQKNPSLFPNAQKNDFLPPGFVGQLRLPPVIL